MNNVWQQMANSYHPGTDALKTQAIPPGLYRYEDSPKEWWLEWTAANFEFPYKIYGNHDHIIQRVKTAWGSLEGNLGVLLTGIKGTGKTVSAQLLANWAVENGIPVLVVSHPIPLVEVLEHLNQPVVVVFDEFEKTHAEKEDQQALLTALDGMARSRHKRMYVFTTNSKTVDENFLDRPSRIRYCWDFRRLGDDVIEMLLDDLLQPDVAHLRTDILTYLAARKVLSIDVAKTVINEVNLFKEAPSAFAEMMNLSEQDAAGYTLEVINEQREVLRTLSSFFALHRGENARLRGLLSRTGRDEYINNVLRHEDTWTFQDRHRTVCIEIISPTDVLGEFVCHVMVSHTDTWIGKFHKAASAVGADMLWLDERPADWHIPEWARKSEQGVMLTDDEDLARSQWSDEDTVFGTPKKQAFLIRITPNYDSPMSRYGNISLA